MFVNKRFKHENVDFEDFPKISDLYMTVFKLSNTNSAFICSTLWKCAITNA